MKCPGGAGAPAIVRKAAQRVARCEGVGQILTAAAQAVREARAAHVGACPAGRFEGCFMRRRFTRTTTPAGFNK